MLRLLLLPVPAGLPSTSQRAAVAQIRKLVRSGNWDEARSLLDSFARDYQGDPRISSLDQEFQAARNAARDEHMAQLDAARKVNDPDRVLELHKFLGPLLEATARASLEADLSRWFLRLIHNGSDRADPGRSRPPGRPDRRVVSHTVEGASLHASLPTLRRSAGLCPRSPSLTPASPRPAQTAWNWPSLNKPPISPTA